MSLVKVAALFETSLQAKIAPAATTMTLVNGTDKDGNTLTGLYGLVIDEGSANEEFVIGTVAGTSVTAMIRDIDVSSPSIAGTGKDHRRGASVKITDYPFLGIIWRILSGNEGLESIIKYNSELTPTGQYDLVYKKWVEDRNGYWTGAVANFAALPIGTVEGEARVTLDDGKIYVWDVATATTATISSIDLGTNVITMTGAHGLSTGDYIYFATSGTLPAGLAVNTAYYVYVDSATELHVSLTIAGATVDITDAGTGTHTIKEASWVLAGAGGGAGTVYVTNKLGTGADDAPTNTTFTLTAGSWADQKYLQVYVNGVLQEYGPMEDYTTADSNTVVFNTGVEDTDKVTLLVVSVDLYNPAWGAVNADILPDTHNTYNIGATGTRFKDAYLEGNVDIDGTLNVEGVATFQASPVVPTLSSGDNSTKAASTAYVDAGLGVKKLLLTASGVSFNNTTAETTLFTTTLTGGSLSTNNGVRIRILISDFDMVSGRTFTVKLNYGATTLYSLDIPSSAVASSLKGEIVCYLFANGATNAQVGAGNIVVHTVSTFDQISGSAYNVASGTATEDSTANKTLAVTGSFSGAASAGNSFTSVVSLAEIIK